GAFGIVFGANVPHARALMRRKNREPDSVPRQQVQTFQIDGSFRQPHAFRLASKAMLEVGDAPADLRDFVLRGGEWKDDVVVDLSDRRAMAAKSLHADAIGVDDFPIAQG